MPLLPEQHAARIAFFQNRTSLWNTNAIAIGTTAAAVTALGTAATSAASALATQGVAQDAAKAATLNLKLAMNNLTNLGMAIVEQVRTKARSAGDGVYALANLPEPATPSPRSNPGTPFDFKVELLGDGSIDVAFKCENAGGGTMYQVYRKLAGQPDTSFTYIGGSGQRKFLDDSIPAGSVSVVYQVQAVRSTAIGNFAQFIVNFGKSAAGATTATLGETMVKLAA